ncbi:MAG: hypothetical protein QG630_465 [Patescibacteria group bacterium]|nr:hypothetical protein [Patescibacteria group bacterium]
MVVLFCTLHVNAQKIIKAPNCKIQNYVPFKKQVAKLDSGTIISVVEYKYGNLYTEVETNTVLIKKYLIKTNNKKIYCIDENLMPVNVSFKKFDTVYVYTGKFGEVEIFLK